MIIDYHSHLSLMSDTETWPEALEKLLFDMEKNNIDKRVIIADNLVDSGCADTKKLLEMTADQPKLVIIGSINPITVTNEDISYFDQLLTEKKIIAMKIFPGHEPIFADDELYDNAIQLCLKHSVPLVIHTGMNTGDRECAKYNDPKRIALIAKAHPEIKIIICHYFWPEIEYCFEQTATLDNIYYDLSAMADQEVLDESGGIEAMREIIQKTLTIKPKSFLFGTDYPMCDTAKHRELVASLNLPKDSENTIYRNALFEI